MAHLPLRRRDHYARRRRQLDARSLFLLPLLLSGCLPYFWPTKIRPGVYGLVQDERGQPEPRARVEVCATNTFGDIADDSDLYKMLSTCPLRDSAMTSVQGTFSVRSVRKWMWEDLGFGGRETQTDYPATEILVCASGDRAGRELLNAYWSDGYRNRGSQNPLVIKVRTTHSNSAWGPALRRFCDELQRLRPSVGR